ncbi:MAG: ROK family protein [Nannocystaceae bacterium]|nr:ROK family protein [Nannocystaceae bacterium]
MRTLTIDIGGTGIKMIPLNAKGVAVGERVRELTPHPSKPDAVLAVIEPMLRAQKAYDRVSVGFPGVVKQGVVSTAPNLGNKAWRGFDLQTAIETLAGKPTRVINDAELQGYGVIEGKGVEIVLTFGTGLGTALYVDGRLVPNLELGHHPLRKGKTYEDLVRDDVLARIGKKRWRKRVALILATLAPIFNYDRLYIGGGNARRIRDPLPPGVERFDNVEGMEGGVALWGDANR